MVLMKSKKCFLLLLVFVLTFSMAACNSQQTAKNPAENEKEVKVSKFRGKYIVDANYVILRAQKKEIMTGE